MTERRVNVSSLANRSIAAALLPLKEVEASRIVGCQLRTPRRFLILTEGIVVLMCLLCVVNTNYQVALYPAGFLHCRS